VGSKGSSQGIGSYIAVIGSYIAVIATVEFTYFLFKGIFFVENN
jgi:hypothetical protein